VTALYLDFGESSLEYTCPVSPLPEYLEYYVFICPVSPLSSVIDFGESSLEYVCPVSPSQEYYVSGESFTGIIPVR
jgi:hypothetical protein